MKVTFLGSGAWEGIPAPFCSCTVCHIATNHPTSKNNRMRPLLLCETREGKFLLEASPDVRIQSTKFNLSPITDFVISHWHFDHMYGLHDLLSWMKRLEKKPTVHCSKNTKEVLDREFGYLPLEINLLPPLKPFTLCGVTITPLPVYHMFLRDNNTPQEELANTYGYLLEHGGKRVAYLSDYYRIPEITLEKIQGVDALIADGTYLSTNEYENLKPNHVHGDAILRLTKSISTKTVYYHSISHLTRRTHEQLQLTLPPSHFISYDGMEIELGN